MGQLLKNPLYSEYENELEIFDDDWSTAPSETQARMSTEFNHRAEAYSAHQISLTKTNIG